MRPWTIDHRAQTIGRLGSSWQVLCGLLEGDRSDAVLTNLAGVLANLAYKNDSNRAQAPPPPARTHAPCARACAHTRAHTRKRARARTHTHTDLEGRGAASSAALHRLAGRRPRRRAARPHDRGPGAKP